MKKNLPAGTFKRILKRTLFLTLFLSPTLSILHAADPSASTADHLSAQAVSDRNLFFSVTEPGQSMPIIWGLDLAWLSEGNIRRGLAFMGPERVDLVRSSFTPTSPLVNGQLQSAEMATLNERLRIIRMLPAHTRVVLNCDHPTVDPWFDKNPAGWAQLIDITTRHHQNEGRTVVTVSPYNEPDYGWGQGTVSDFYDIAGELRNNPLFDNIRISGGNTLNTDAALSWYNQLSDRLDEGNTHQLAGSFDNYALFYQTVRANGHHGTNDELHNVMEAMVGVEYGMQTGIWWGTAEYARGEFVKASDGERLAYAEHRPNWTAASVYRAPDGKVQAFAGTSERQAVTTTYNFVSKDREVFFDGHGPQRVFALTLPGGTGYQTGQTNAERVVNISWGDDIQPLVNGTYLLINRHSGKALQVTAGSSTPGSLLRQYSPSTAASQTWEVKPVDPRIGEDFSYFTIKNAASGLVPDVLNWSLDDNTDIIAWDDTKGKNQQWYLEYAEDGWFYIRSRHSAYCLQPAGGSSSNGIKITQGIPNGAHHQQWRFIPAGTTVEFDAPSAPENLSAQGRELSIQLQWSPLEESDLSYTIFRSTTPGGPYQTIGRDVTATTFTDHTIDSGKTYYYAVKAVDGALNRSDYSNEASAQASGEDAMVARLTFDGDTRDQSPNLYHGAGYGGITYVVGQTNAQALRLNGSTGFVQLPPTIVHHDKLTVATWIRLNRNAMWQRIFDFGNGTDQYLFLTTQSNNNKLRFAIKNGGAEETLEAPALTLGKWTHLAVTLNGNTVQILLDGEVAAESDHFSITPKDIKPLLNYIGRSQFPDPMLAASLADFRLYNYPLAPEEVQSISADLPTHLEPKAGLHNPQLSVWPNPASDQLYLSWNGAAATPLQTVTLFTMSGQTVLSHDLSAHPGPISIAQVPPGIYLLRVNHANGTLTQKITIQR